MNKRSDRLALIVIFTLAGLLIGTPVILGLLSRLPFVAPTITAIVVAITTGPDPLATAISVALTGTHLASAHTPRLSDADQTATVLATRTPPPPTHTPTPVPTRVLGYWTATAAVRLTQLAQDGIMPTLEPGCYFNWGTQELPELTAQIQSSVDAARLENVTVRASAFGENCYTFDTDEVDYFAAMQTDFHVTAQVENLDDETALGDLTAQILVILNAIPAEDKSGPMSGQIILTFVQGDQQIVLPVSVQQTAEIMEQGLSGAALWAALNATRQSYVCHKN